MAVAERPAEACGGCFHEPPPPPPAPRTGAVVTDHRMIVSISKGQTTLYDELRYSGSPQSFAWVLPISGTAKVGVSSDGVFSTLEAMTQVTVIPPPMDCPVRPNNCSSGFSDESAGAASDPQSPGPGVTVTKQETVGPYETVQLHANEGGSALNDWLTSHGYVVTDDIKPIIDQYVAEHFDFLALKLVPGAGVQAMRPVRVTTTGASAVLPLRMVSAGTGANVGIVLWTVAEGRYEPQNFPFFQIKAEELVWDWTTYSSNLATLRTERSDALGGRGWEHESSVSFPLDQMENYLRNGYCQPFNGGQNGGYNGGGPAAGPINTCSSGQNDYEDEDGGQNPGKTKQQVQEEDLATLLAGIPGNVRVTRVRAQLAHASLDRDLVLQASADQSVLSPARQVTRELNQPICTVYQGCDAVGSAPRDEAKARSGGTGESFACATTNLKKRGNTLLTIGAFVALGLIAVKRLRKKKN
jgi:Uncharacterized protein conserved in bacteria (DUF2330)